MTIKFFIQSKKVTSTIYVRVCDGKNDAKSKTNLVYNFSLWSNQSGKPKNNKDEKGKLLIVDLEAIRATIIKEYNKSEGKRTINTEWLKEVLNPPKLKEEIPLKLYDYFTHFLKHKKSTLKASTLTKAVVNQNMLKRFQEENHHEYLISEIDANFCLKFQKYCEENNYSHNTFCRAMKFFKTVCYHAERNGIELHKTFKYIKVKFEPVEIIHLSLDELKKIEQTELPHDYLQNARKWLLISCETGQRVSDFLRFKKAMIRYEDKIPYIEFKQVKTEKLMPLPLSPKVMKILAENKGEFPRKISSVNYNIYIKEVCQLAGINEPILSRIKNPETKKYETGFYPKWQMVSSHIGRRSFATNNYGVIPTPLLMLGTGHTSEEMFMKYIGKTGTDLIKQLAKYLYKENNQLYLSNAS